MTVRTDRYSRSAMTVKRRKDKTVKAVQKRNGMTEQKRKGQYQRLCRLPLVSRGEAQIDTEAER